MIYMGDVQNAWKIYKLMDKVCWNVEMKPQNTFDDVIYWVEVILEVWGGGKIPKFFVRQAQTNQGPYLVPTSGWLVRVWRVYDGL